MMVFEHDFEQFPELTNRQIEEIGFRSPHKQITEDFRARVIRVHDGDTITIRAGFRDFDFPLRFLDIDAPELNEGGEKARSWLKARIEGKRVEVRINKQNRVDKYGRLLGKIIHLGLDVGEEMLMRRLATPFNKRNEGKIPNWKRMITRKQWF